MGEDTTMTVRELRAALGSMDANSDVQVVLFKNDGTSEVFELEEVLNNEGHAQLEIYEDEPVRERIRRAKTHGRPIISHRVRRRPPG